MLVSVERRFSRLVQLFFNKLSSLFLATTFLCLFLSLSAHILLPFKLWTKKIDIPKNQFFADAWCY